MKCNIASNVATKRSFAWDRALRSVAVQPGCWMVHERVHVHQCGTRFRERHGGELEVPN